MTLVRVEIRSGFAQVCANDTLQVSIGNIIRCYESNDWFVNHSFYVLQFSKVAVLYNAAYDLMYHLTEEQTRVIFDLWNKFFNMFANFWQSIWLGRVFI